MIKAAIKKHTPAAVTVTLHGGHCGMVVSGDLQCGPASTSLQPSAHQAYNLWKINGSKKFNDY